MFYAFGYSQSVLYFWNYFLHVERLFAISQLFDGGYIKVKTKAPANNG